MSPLQRKMLRGQAVRGTISSSPVDISSIQRSTYMRNTQGFVPDSVNKTQGGKKWIDENS